MRRDPTEYRSERSVQLPTLAASTKDEEGRLVHKMKSQVPISPSYICLTRSLEVSNTQRQLSAFTQAPVDACHFRRPAIHAIADSGRWRTNPGNCGAGCHRTTQCVKQRRCAVCPAAADLILRRGLSSVRSPRVTRKTVAAFTNGITTVCLLTGIDPFRGSAAAAGRGPSRPRSRGAEHGRVQTARTTGYLSRSCCPGPCGLLTLRLNSTAAEFFWPRT